MSVDKPLSYKTTVRLSITDLLSPSVRGEGFQLYERELAHYLPFQVRTYFDFYLKSRRYFLLRDTELGFLRERLSESFSCGWEDFIASSRCSVGLYRVDVSVRSWIFQVPSSYVEHSLSFLTSDRRGTLLHLEYSE